MIRAPEPSLASRWRQPCASGVVLTGCSLALPAWAEVSGTHVLAVSGVVSALSLVVALAVMAWALRTDRRLQATADALRRSQAEVRGMTSLLDVWQWRTDADLRVVELHAPPGVQALPSELIARRPLLWELFASDEATTRQWRSQLEQRAAFTDIPADTALADRPPCVLQGVALRDDTGRFTGYMGTARDLIDRRDELLDEVIQTLPTPALRVCLSLAGQPTALNGHNSAASQWLGDAAPPTLPWADALDRLPAALRPVVEQALLQPTLVATMAEGWSVRAHRLSSAQPAGGGTEALLLFQRLDSPPAFNDTQRDDQESFGYTVSHDLRAPIRVVEGFTKIVKEDYGRLLDRIGNDHLDRVLGAAARMNSMIDSLLGLSQLSSRPLARQPVNLSQLAGYIIDDLRRQAPEREVVVEIEAGLQAHGDATLLRVVLENLLGNAWKYTGKCRTARIWFEASEHEGRPAITVRDNGAGFDMRFADRLFGVFQRLHSANDFQGTGIGLASVRRIVRRHGGDIWAEGAVDRGARFQFWLGPEGLKHDGGS